MPRPGTRGKLAAAILLVVAIALGAAFLAVFLATRAELRSQTEADLRVKSNEVVAALSRKATNDSPDRQAFEAAVSQPVSPESFVVAVSLPSGFVATNEPDFLQLERGRRQGSDEGSDSLDDEEGREEERESGKFLTAGVGYSEQRLETLGSVMILTRPVVIEGSGPAVVRVAKSLEPVEEALDGLKGTFLLVGLIALFASAVLAWLLATRLTRPLRELTGVAEAVGEGDLSQRMPLAEAGRDETLRLSESFNQMLDRLEDAFARQRTFVADASHDLRTPLTIIRGQLDVLARDPDPDPEEVKRVSGVVNEATGRMERLVADLLALARAEEGNVGKVEEVQLEDLIPDAVAASVDRDRIEVGPVAEAVLRVDRDALVRAIANLLDNALTHTGPEGRVEISAPLRGGVVEIVVDDDGPGIPARDRQRIFDRFSRLDEARTGDKGGSGIGLAIVRAVAEANGGTVACLDSPLGGARFVLSLPDAGNPEAIRT